METWIIVGVILATIFILIALYFLRESVHGRKFREDVDLSGKVALVTGANSGIGKQLAKELAKRGARVYMLCRSVKRGNDARQELISENNQLSSDNLRVRELDLCSFASVRQFVADFEKEEPQVDLLFLNAGVMWVKEFEKTVDGYETTLQADHLGHFLLTELLMPKLDAAAEARVISVSGGLHLLSDECKIDVMNDPVEFSGWKSYNRAKLANVVHAVELTKRLRARNSRVCINSLHPGVVRTGLARGTIVYWLMQYPMRPLVWFFMRYEWEGAQCPLYVGLSRELVGVSGEYFDDFKISKTHRMAKDAAACRRFYEESLRAVGLGDGSA